MMKTYNAMNILSNEKCAKKTNSFILSRKTFLSIHTNLTSGKLSKILRLKTLSPRTIRRIRQRYSVLQNIKKFNIMKKFCTLCRKKIKYLKRKFLNNLSLIVSNKDISFK